MWIAALRHALSSYRLSFRLYLVGENIEQSQSVDVQWSLLERTVEVVGCTTCAVRLPRR